MNIDQFVTKIWFKGSFWCYLFLPLSLIYGFITSFRRFLFRINVKKSYLSKVPIIVVGNITVGGNGKTPVVISLVEHFQKQNLRVGVVSRGYKSSPKSFPYIVNDQSSVLESGDEPFLIFKKTKALVVIDPIRSRAVKHIENDVDLIITDDGLQHYALNRDIEIIVIDNKRRFGNGFLIPAGPLREGIWRLKTADLLINNCGMVSKNFKNDVNLKNNQTYENEYQMFLVPGEPYSINNPIDTNLDTNKDVVTMAGIGDPKRFDETVMNLGFKVKETISIGDHGVLDISILNSFSKDIPLLMTEKDMVKYIGEDLNNNVYAVPIKAKISDNFFINLDKLVAKIKSNKNNSKDYNS
ncbi:MAG: tetraacyldisaccharide 4'-kinase [Succinivibrionaceae bacterium]